MKDSLALRDEVRRRRRRIRSRLLRWAVSNSRDFPWRDPGRSAYEVLVAELLLKRTTSTAAARLYPTFLDRFPSVSAIAEAPAPYLEDTLRPVGLYRQRAHGLRQMATHLQDTHDGEVPPDIDALERVPHTGPYAARAVASFAFHQSAAIVDSNVVRILKRVFRASLPDRPSADTFQQVADLLLPKRQHRSFNYALLDLGAGICRYVRPRCTECPLRPVCDYALGASETLP